MSDFRWGGRMCLFLLWRWAVVHGCPSNFSRSSRFGQIISRFSRFEFPSSPLREFSHNGLICLKLFASESRFRGANRKNSRLDGKNRESYPHRRSGRQPSLPVVAASFPIILSCRLPLAASAPPGPQWRHSVGGGFASPRGNAAGVGSGTGSGFSTVSGLRASAARLSR